MPRAGRVYRVDFWHVDQAMSIFVNGKRVGNPLTYDWTPHDRIEQAFGMSFEAWKQRAPRIGPAEPQLRWNFYGSPVTLHRVRVDRDLYYRADTLTSQATKNVTSPGYEALVRANTPAFGTHPDSDVLRQPCVTENSCRRRTIQPFIVPRCGDAQNSASGLDRKPFGGDYFDRRERPFGSDFSFNSSVARRWIASSVSSSRMRRFAAASSACSDVVTPASSPASTRASRRQV